MSLVLYPLTCGEVTIIAEATSWQNTHVAQLRASTDIGTQGNPWIGNSMSQKGADRARGPLTTGCQGSRLSQEWIPRTQSWT